ncbi:hypothetical protein F4782DRAFT_182636 [Xylaria castorea]|nr:hypothetical protein F4782DRAFT_182636 [Xylaria castorea]
MTSAVTPSKHLQMSQAPSQPHPPPQSPVTPASPPSKRADLKSWWKKFQVQPTRHHETRAHAPASKCAPNTCIAIPATDEPAHPNSEISKAAS